MFLELVRLIGGGIASIATLVVISLLAVECCSEGAISDMVKEALKRRAARKEDEAEHRQQQEVAEQRHRHRMELLKQLEQLSALEGITDKDKGSEYAKLRDRLLAELDTSLEAAAAADASSDEGPEAPTRKKARRSRKSAT